MEHSKGFGAAKITESSFNSDDLDLFNPPVIEKSIVSGRQASFRPLSENTNGPYMFNLQSQGADQYLQLNSIRLGGKALIREKSGELLTDADNVSIVNLFPHSLFRAHEIEINNVLVTDLSSFSAHYQAYIQTIMSFNKSAQETHLKSQLFEMDTAGEYDTIDKPASGGKKNKGNSLREKICAASNLFDFYIPLCSDILQSDRLLHSSANLKLKLLRASDSFSLLSDSSKDLEIHLSDLKLYANYVKIDEPMIRQHNSKMLKSPLIYPITRTLLKEYHFSSGEKSCYIPNLFTGKLPKSLVVGMVRDDSANGSTSLNPFNFQHFDLSESYLKLNGEMVPSDPLAPRFSEGHYKREYSEMLRNVGIDAGEDHGNCITPAQFAGGSFFMCYDLTGHKCNMLHRHESLSGNVDLSLIFKNSLPQNIRVIVYASTDAQIELSAENDVTVRYV